MTGLEFEWDGAKETANAAKHGVSFAEAATVFGDLLSLTVSDPEHSEVEQRLAVMGESSSGRLLVVSHVERGQNIRIISARLATRRERRDYEQT